MKVSATLKGPKDTLGRQKVYIRVSDGRKRKFKATSILIAPKDWNGLVRSSHPDYKELNHRIKTMILDFESRIFNEKKDFLFTEYVNLCLKEWQGVKKESTIRHMISYRDKFNSFKAVKLSQVTPDLLTKFVNYCRAKENIPNTIWSSLKFVRVIIRKAYKEKLIQENPFDLFSMPKYTDPHKTYLTKEQVSKIEEFVFNCPDHLRQPGAWFLISCYTGLRYGDQINFNKNQIKDGRLIVYTSKTGQAVSIKMNDKLKSLFELVNYQPLSLKNSPYGISIKAIAAEVGITENISPHTGRHTFGTLCASAGISQEVTAKLMGHKSLRTTAIYYTLTSDRLDSEIDKIFT